MSDADHENEQHVISNRVYHPKVTDTDPEEAFGPFELHYARWARVRGKRIDRLRESALDVARKLASARRADGRNSIR